MQHIRQPPGSGLCLAACVAMVTNCTLEEVVAGCRILTSVDGVQFLPDNEAARFMATKWRLYGLRLRFEAPKALEADVTHIQTEIGIQHWPAILSVASVNFPGFEHAVVWDNVRRVVLDPLKAEPAAIEDYEILEWTPVCEL